jgi:TrmH family RNA methyltransferase
MPEIDITSTANPKLRSLAALRDRKTRDRQARFVVEGAGDIERAIDAGLNPIEVYYDPDWFETAPFVAGIVGRVESAALDRVSYRGKSRGVIAVFSQFPVGLDDLELGANPLILMLEAVEKPGNLGAILRTADAVGADAVIAADPGTDPFNPNVIRAATGTLFTTPLAVSDLGAAIDWLHGRGVIVVAADPSREANLWSSELTGPCALLVGAESRGLSDEARNAADVIVSIPMKGVGDSLNTSVAAAVLAYEALRQRT